MATADPDVVALLEQIREELHALPAAIAAAIGQQRHVRRRLSRADEAALVALLPVIWAAIGNLTFTSRELHEHAKLDIASSYRLREVLACIGSPRKIGRLLSRGDDVDVGGYRIVVNGRSREGMLFTCAVISRETR